MTSTVFIPLLFFVDIFIIVRNGNSSEQHNYAEEKVY